MPAPVRPSAPPILPAPKKASKAPAKKSTPEAGPPLAGKLGTPGQKVPLPGKPSSKSAPQGKGALSPQLQKTFGPLAKKGVGAPSKLGSAKNQKEGAKTKQSLLHELANLDLKAAGAATSVFSKGQGPVKPLATIGEAGEPAHAGKIGEREPSNPFKLSGGAAKALDVIKNQTLGTGEAFIHDPVGVVKHTASSLPNIASSLVGEGIRGVEETGLGAAKTLPGNPLHVPASEGHPGKTIEEFGKSMVSSTKKLLNETQKQSREEAEKEGVAAKVLTFAPIAGGAGAIVGRLGAKAAVRVGIDEAAAQTAAREAAIAAAKNAAEGGASKAAAESAGATAGHAVDVALHHPEMRAFLEAKGLNVPKLNKAGTDLSKSAKAKAFLHESTQARPNLRTAPGNEPVKLQRGAAVRPQDRSPNLIKASVQTAIDNRRRSYQLHGLERMAHERAAFEKNYPGEGDSVPATYAQHLANLTQRGEVTPLFQHGGLPGSNQFIGGTKAQRMGASYTGSDLRRTGQAARNSIHVEVQAALDKLSPEQQKLVVLAKEGHVPLHDPAKAQTWLEEISRQAKAGSTDASGKSIIPHAHAKSGSDVARQVDSVLKVMKAKGAESVITPEFQHLVESIPDERLVSSKDPILAQIPDQVAARKYLPQQRTLDAWAEHELTKANPHPDAHSTAAAVAQIHQKLEAGHDLRAGARAAGPAHKPDLSYQGSHRPPGPADGTALDQLSQDHQAVFGVDPQGMVRVSRVTKNGQGINNGDWVTAGDVTLTKSQQELGFTLSTAEVPANTLFHNPGEENGALGYHGPSIDHEVLNKSRARTEHLASTPEAARVTMADAKVATAEAELRRANAGPPNADRVAKAKLALKNAKADRSIEVARVTRLSGDSQELHARADNAFAEAKNLADENAVRHGMPTDRAYITHQRTRDREAALHTIGHRTPSDPKKWEWVLQKQGYRSTDPALIEDSMLKSVRNTLAVENIAKFHERFAVPNVPAGLTSKEAHAELLKKGLNPDHYEVASLGKIYHNIDQRNLGGGDLVHLDLNPLDHAKALGDAVQQARGVNPGDTSKGFQIYPTTALKELQGNLSAQHLSLRAYGKVKGKFSSLMLGTNPGWATNMSAVTYPTQALLGGAKPWEFPAAAKWYKGLSEGDKRSFDLQTGTDNPFKASDHQNAGSHEAGAERLGSTALNLDRHPHLAQIVDTMQMFRKSPVGRILSSPEKASNLVLKLERVPRRYARIAVASKHMKTAALDKMLEEAKGLHAAQGSLESRMLHLKTVGRMPSDQYMQEILHSVPHMEAVAEKTARMMGEWQKMTNFERNVASKIPLFYPWIRYSINLATKGLPAHHPLGYALAGATGVMSREDMRRLLGTDTPMGKAPLGREQPNVEPKNREFDWAGASQADPLVNQATSIISGTPAGPVGALPPFIAAPLEWMINRNALTDKPLKKSEPYKFGQHEENRPSLPGTMAAKDLESFDPGRAYQDIQELSSGQAQADNSLFGNKPMHYSPRTEADIKKEIEEKKKAGVEREVGKYVLPLLPHREPGLLRGKISAEEKEKKKEKEEAAKKKAKKNKGGIPTVEVPTVNIPTVNVPTVNVP